MFQNDVLPLVGEDVDVSDMWYGAKIYHDIQITGRYTLSKNSSDDDVE